MAGGVVFGVTSHCILAPHLSHLLSANFAEFFLVALLLVLSKQHHNLNVV
jgi:hypothetical protein